MIIKLKKYVEYLGWLLFFEMYINELLYYGRIFVLKVYLWVLIRNNGVLKDLRKWNFVLKFIL